MLSVVIYISHTSLFEQVETQFFLRLAATTETFDLDEVTCIFHTAPLEKYPAN